MGQEFETSKLIPCWT